MICHERNGNNITVRYHYMYIRMAQMKTNDNAKCQKDTEQLEVSFTASFYAN